MASVIQQQPEPTRVEIEFPIWYRTFSRSYVAWASAPNDLKAPLLLHGPALAKAESWMLVCPEKLTESHKRFIVRSMTQRAKETGEAVVPSRGRPSKSKWRRASNRGFLQLYAVIALGLWVFAPDIIRDTMQQALDPSGASAKHHQAMAKAQLRPVDDEVATVAAAAPAPIADVPEVSPQSRSPSPDAEKSPSISIPAPPATPAAAPRFARLTELAREKLNAGQTRVALLIGIEAAEEALKSDASGAGTSHPTANSATALLARAMATREEIGPFAQRSAASQTTLFCDEGRALIAIAADETLSVWGAGSVRRIASWELAASNINAARADRDCRRLLVPNDDFNVEIKPISGPRLPVQLIGHEAPIRAAAFSPDGNSVVTASQDSTARVWDARTGRQRFMLSGHDWHVLGAEFSADGRSIVTASADKTSRIWDAATGRQLHVLTGHRGVVTSARFDADGARVLTVSWDGYARLFDAATGKLLFVLKHDLSVVEAELSPDGRRIATTDSEGGLQIWDASTGKLDHSSPGGGAADAIRQAVFTPDGRWLVVLSWNGGVVLHGIESRTRGAVLAAPGQRVRSVTLGRGGQAVVAVTEGGARLSWPLIASASEAIAQAKSMAPSCLSPDERVMLGVEGEQPAWCAQLRTRGAALP